MRLGAACLHSSREPVVRIQAQTMNIVATSAMCGASPARLLWLFATPPHRTGAATNNGVAEDTSRDALGESPLYKKRCRASPTSAGGRP